MNNKRKLLAAFFFVSGIFFMFDSLGGDVALNYLIGIFQLNVFVPNMVIGFLLGLAFSVTGSLFWLGADEPKNMLPQ